MELSPQVITSKGVHGTRDGDGCEDSAGIIIDLYYFKLMDLFWFIIAYVISSGTWLRLLGYWRIFAYILDICYY